MSGSTRTLIDSPFDSLRQVLPAARSTEAWHQAITDELRQRLGPAHAALFARPLHGANSIAWAAEGQDVRRFSDLPNDGRRALTAAIGSMLSDIRRLVESGTAPAVAAAWPALREVPDYTHVFAVDGRPVLAGWGHLSSSGRSGLFARVDDGLAWRAPPRPPWRTYATAFVGLGLLAVAAGLLLPLLAPWIIPSPASCTVSPEQLAMLRQQNTLTRRNHELYALLADLRDREGRERLQCPLPRQQALAEPPPVAAPLPPPAAPVPPPAAAPRPPQPPPALPEDRWNQRDLSLLNGCWHKYTNMVTVQLGTGIRNSVRSWQLCFHGAGQGHQTIVWTDGATCNGDLRASFNSGGTLELKDVSNCQGSRRMVPAESTCRRLSDSEAECDMRDQQGPAAAQHQAIWSKFRR
jgi:hypothetical protein